MQINQLGFESQNDYRIHIEVLALNRAVTTAFAKPAVARAHHIIVGKIA